MLFLTNRQKTLLVIFVLGLSSLSVTLFTANHNVNRNNDSTEQTPSQQPLIVPLQGAQAQSNSLMNPNVIHQFPLGFEQNTGQIGTSEIAYYFKTNTIQINFLQSKVQFNQKISGTEALITFDLTFKGSNTVNPVALHKIAGNTNYFIGKDKITNVPSFKDMYYYNIYNGIDLHYYFTNQGLKYEFIVHPGANPNQIVLTTSSNTYFSATGTNLSFNNKETGLTLIQDSNLFVYQQTSQKVTTIPASYHVSPSKSNVVSYNIGSYDSAHNLIIDPVLVVNASTYLGGKSVDSGIDIVRDSQKNIYIAGQVNSTDFLTVNPLGNSNHTSTNNATIIVLKLNATGTGIIWSTYYGGSGNDLVSKIRLDDNGNVVLIGSTDSVDFPLKASQNAKLNGTTDAFIVVLSNYGNSVVLSSLIGGTGMERANGLYISQGTGDYYITGTTTSQNFTVTQNAFEKVYQNGTEYGYDAFLMKLSNTGAIQYSTLIAGNGDDQGFSVGMDSQNNIYVMGSTNSNLTGILHKGLDVFILKFNSSLQFNQSKLIGGGFNDFPTDMVVSPSGIYVTGRTYSVDFPVNTTAFGKTFSTESAFVFKLNDTLGLTYSTFYGNSSIFSSKISVDSKGQATIAGYIISSSIPLKDEYKKISVGNDGFITTFNSLGTNITYSTYFGGNGLDHINSFVPGTNDNLYLVGVTTSTDFPVLNSIQSNIASYGSSDMFFTKLSKDYITPTLTVKPDFSYKVGTTGHNLTFSASDNDPFASYFIYKNGSLEQTGLLPTSLDNYSVDGLPVGVYNYTVLARDRTGNFVKKTTLVTVFTANPTTTNPVSSTPSSTASKNQLLQAILILVALAIIVGIASAAFVLNKRNKEASQQANKETTLATEQIDTKTDNVASLESTASQSNQNTEQPDKNSLNKPAGDENTSNDQ